MGKARKQLVVKTGPLQPPEADKAAGAASGSGKELKDMTKGPMFRKYFQTGDDDEEGGAGHGELEEALGDGGLAPEDLWAEVRLWGMHAWHAVKEPASERSASVEESVAGCVRPSDGLRHVGD